jgi:ubiquinone/menaquinone biosynthesis C-methylase UbiE
MDDFWAKPAGVNVDGPDYWQYIGLQLVAQAGINPGASVLDVGCGTGSSLFPAARLAEGNGKAIGIDICPT